MSDDDHHPQFTSAPSEWQTLKPAAQEMRHQPTAAEDILWQRIRNRRIGGVKFRRQHSIASFIVDFASIEKMLVIEVDGEIHEDAVQQEYDKARQAILEALGFRVLRFTNKQVLQSLENVAKTIADALAATQENHLD